MISGTLVPPNSIYPCARIMSIIETNKNISSIILTERLRLNECGQTNGITVSFLVFPIRITLSKRLTR